MARLPARWPNISDQGLQAWILLDPLCHTVLVDLPLLDNVISVKSWKRNPWLVIAQLEVGIWQLWMGLLLESNWITFLSRVVLFLDE